ncbi:hypothetical protein K490DRAFT_50057 [Saccharata proteae CBS 121410]|uniref:Uncharacterized protein n=1 Tax=Saccharata proteae CBS 121410 TaxID=1314787 RepID=A0A9P4LVF4_9PEZI|nr:hypothetical protein K490DRAFT_50057 [Saccharata proteae CBS 121410]
MLTCGQWYWKLVSLLASWMILGGYLIAPSLYDESTELRINKAGLTIFLVALLVAGYAFTALLCFACKSLIFQAESIFLPSLASSALGLLTVLYNCIAHKNFAWNAAAIAMTVLSGGMTLIYSLLLIYTNRRISRLRRHLNSRSQNMWQGSSYYDNWIANMFPSVKSSANNRGVSPPMDGYFSHNHTPGVPLTEDDMVNQQMAMLLMKNDSGPSPDASQNTFRIDLPEDSDPEQDSPNARRMRNAHPPASAPNPAPVPAPIAHRYGERGSHNRGRSDTRGTPSMETMRAKSREERRQEIELGQLVQAQPLSMQS